MYIKAEQIGLRSLLLCVNRPVKPSAAARRFEAAGYSWLSRIEAHLFDRLWYTVGGSMTDLPDWCGTQVNIGLYERINYMQAWQYLFINYFKETQQEEWQLSYISDPELEETVKGLTIPDASNLLGGQGWELISFNPVVVSDMVGNLIDWPSDVRARLEDAGLIDEINSRFFNSLRMIKLVFKRQR
jgi:hypothetical protein